MRFTSKFLINFALEIKKFFVFRKITENTIIVEFSVDVGNRHDIEDLESLLRRERLNGLDM